MNAQLTSTTHFFHVPVRVVSAIPVEPTDPPYQLIFDFMKINVTYFQSAILYELVEAPANTQLGIPTIEPTGLFETFVDLNGLLAGMLDIDTNLGFGSAPSYAVTLTATVNGQLISSDPQVINNPIKG